MKVWLTIFHNETEDEDGRHPSFWRGFEPGDNLVNVWEGEVPFEGDDPATLEWAWRQFNHVDGTELVAELPIRSLAVGDLVHILRRTEDPLCVGTGLYACAAVGWNHVTEEQVAEHLAAQQAAEALAERVEKEAQDA